MGGIVRLLIGVVFVAVGIAFATLRSGAADAPQTRDFDIATVERLGRDMFEQDRRAAKATDVMLADRSAAGARDSVAGWVTTTINGKPAVRFVREGEGGPEALYDVLFDGAVTSPLITPADRTLSAEDIAQHRARRLAVKDSDRRCADRYNTIALKDAQGGGWLVWVLVATTDADAIPIGVSYRFSITPDGGSVSMREATSRGCLIFRRSEVPKTGNSAALAFSHIVSLRPLETHVFASLSYRISLYVGTNDGLSWKVDQGRMGTVEMDAPDMDGFSARHLASMSEQCRGIVTKKGEEPKQYYVPKELTFRVIDMTERGEFVPRAPDGFELTSVTCVRLGIVPAPNDYKVIVAGYPLYIGDNGVGHADRSGVLELSDGRFRFRVTKGTLLPEEEPRVGRRLDAFQQAIRPKP